MIKLKYELAEMIRLSISSATWYKMLSMGDKGKFSKDKKLQGVHKSTIVWFYNIFDFHMTYHYSDIITDRNIVIIEASIECI